jgi:hypothetical protein
MESIILFNTAYATVHYQSEHELVILTWHGNPTAEEYQRPFKEILEFSRKNPVQNMISDITNQGVVNPENRKWFESDMMPKAVAAGLKRAAVVTNGNVFKMYYVNLLLSAINKYKVPLKVFKNTTEAINWITSFLLKKDSITS